MRKIAFIVIAFFFVSICYAGDPKPSVSKYVKDLGGGFLVEGGKLKYGMTYEISKELPRPLHIRIEYQNPTNKKEPFVSFYTLDSGTKLVTQSESFDSAKYRKTYKILLKIFSDEGHTTQLTKHKSKVKFNLPPELANKMGIKLL